jgi:hypothetical protein
LDTCPAFTATTQPSLRATVWLLLTAAAVLFAGCSVNKKLTVAGTAALVEDVAGAAARQSDLRVVREGMPAYLMLLDGMVESWPDNDRLLLAAARAYSSFAASLFGDEDRSYRSALMKRSKTYALQALEQRGINEPLTSPFDGFEAAVQRMTLDDLPFLFWAGSCWAGWISLHRDSIEAIAELPRVEALMRRSLALDERYHYGGPHLFMGIWYASRPPVAGGSLERAQAHFAKAMEIGQGKFLMTPVYFADVYCRKTMDRDLFTSTLETVLSTPADIAPELTLMNTVAHRMAQDLLARADESF